MRLLERVAAAPQVDAVELVTELEQDRELVDLVARLPRDRERLLVRADRIVEAPVRGEDEAGRITRVRAQRGIARLVGGTHCLLGERDDAGAVRARCLGPPARFPAEDQVEECARKQTLRIRRLGARLLQRFVQQVDGARRVAGRLAVRALREGRLGDVDELPGSVQRLARGLVVPRDLEQRVPRRRIVVGDQLLERLRHGGVIEAELVCRAAFVQKLLQRAGIEREEGGAVAPPVLDVLPRDHAAPLADLAELPDDLALVAFDELRQNASEEAPALNRPALEQGALVVLEVGDARREQLAERRRRPRRGERAAQSPRARLAVDRPVERPASAVVAQDALLLEAREVVLDEERRAVADLLQPVREPRGRNGAVAIGEQPLDRLAAEIARARDRALRPARAAARARARAGGGRRSDPCRTRSRGRAATPSAPARCARSPRSTPRRSTARRR